ncbi:MAG: transposase [Chloroflexi bacterium]|nr:transposase [Chloroflexota bacterium]
MRCCSLARTGCQWRYLPERYGEWGAVWQQWRRWRANGASGNGQWRGWRARFGRSTPAR